MLSAPLIGLAIATLIYSVILVAVGLAGYGILQGILAIGSASAANWYYHRARRQL